MELTLDILKEGVRDPRGVINVGAIKWDPEKGVPACRNGDWFDVLGTVNDISRTEDNMIVGTLTLSEEAITSLGLDPEDETLGGVTIGAAYMSPFAVEPGGEITDARLQAVYLIWDFKMYMGIDNGPGTTGESDE